MKKANHISGLGVAGALLLGVAVCLWTAGTVTAQTGSTYCELRLTACPETYDGDTLVVPLDIVSLSANIRSCVSTTGGVVSKGDPPAIMFIIDNTTSMGMQGGNDTRGNRFRVAREIIDTIGRRLPEAEIGVVVFDAGLFLNKSGGKTPIDPNLVAFQGTPYYDPATITEMYMPLKRLNGPALPGGFYTGTNPNPTALELYDSMFVVSGGGGNATGGIRNPAGGTFTNGSGTNVSIAFEAALEAFGKTNIAPKNRYIIFISDGRYEMNVASNLAGGGCSGAAGTTVGTPSFGEGAFGNSARCPRQRDFMAGIIGTQGIPATYTVFLNTDERATMLANRATLDTMTANIKGNQYSETNSTSNIWTADGNDYQGLLTLMMDNIMTNLITQTQATPKKIVVESAGLTDSTDQVVDSSFGFGRMLPIDTGTVAGVNMWLTYSVAVDTVDENNNLISFSRDERENKRFWIRRTANPPANWQSQGLASSCDNKPSIALLYNGVPIDTIKPTMVNDLTVRFTKGGGAGFDFTYTKDNVNIEITTTKNPPPDTLWTKTIQQSGAAFHEDATFLYWDFVLNPNAAANKNNTVLEFIGLNDSIVFYFKNPYIPLDTIRVSKPYVSYNMEFSKNPNDVNALILALDSTKAGEPFNIYALLLGEGGGIDAGMLGSGTITWKLSSNDGASITADGASNSHAVFTGTKTTPDPKDYYTVTATFTSNDGKLTITKSIQLKVNPGNPAYLEVLFTDPANNTPPAQVAPSELVKEKSFEIPKGEKERTLWVVARDEFGNYIGPVSGTWTEEGDAVNIGGGGFSAQAIRANDAFSVGKVIVTNNSGLTATVNVTVVGDGAVAIGPNPFIPGVSDAEARLKSNKFSPDVYKYYEKILQNGAVGGVTGSSRQRPGDTKGILVAATAPKGINMTANGRDPNVTIVIYDAVGNIVFKSQPNEITLVEENNTFGFVWNGKNNKGRTVAPGTYLVKMQADLGGSEQFKEQRKIGVTKGKK